MSNKEQSINIYLYDKDNPECIRTCEIPSHVTEAILIPREELSTDTAKELLDDEATVYFLFGTDEDEIKPIAYIGESKMPLARMRRHKSDPGKEFFDTVVFFRSSKGNMNKAHIQFIESLCVVKGRSANRFIIKNDGGMSSMPTLDRREKNFALNIYEDIKILIGILGYPIFEEKKMDENKRLYINYKNITAEAIYSKRETIYSKKEMTVLKGSQAIVVDEKSYAKFANRKRRELLAEGILQEKNGVLVFTSDYSFRTPSGAAQVIRGRNSNGRTDWKNKSGKTWNELYGG